MLGIAFGVVAIFVIVFGVAAMTTTSRSGRRRCAP
jgi:hypothetical protein